MMQNIQWVSTEEFEQRLTTPLRECLVTFVTHQALLDIFRKEPQLIGNEEVWSGFMGERPVLFRSSRGWPKARLSFLSFAPPTQEGLFPWRILEELRWLPSGLFRKALSIGTYPFVGSGFAVLRHELSGQPWAVYQSPSQRDAQALLEFLQSFGEEEYQLFPIGQFAKPELSSEPKSPA